MSLVETNAQPPAMDTLEECEAVIERGLQSFIDVGNALIAIKMNRLYRQSGFSSFEDYCRDRWDISRPRAYQLVSGAATYAALVDALPEVSTTVDILPTSERQVRPLSSLPERTAAGAWERAVEIADGDQPTAAQVEQAVAEIVPGEPSTREGEGGRDGEHVDDPIAALPEHELSAPISLTGDLPRPTPSPAPKPVLTAEEQRQIDLEEGDRRMARYLEQAITHWSVLRDMRTNPRREQILAHLCQPDLELLARIEEELPC